MSNAAADELERAQALIARMDRQSYAKTEDPWVLLNQLRRLVELCEAAPSFRREATQLTLGAMLDPDSATPTRTR